MTKSTITRERLEKIKSWRETYGAGSNVMLPAEEAEELSRMALATMESGPERNPVLSYADSYRDMAKQGVESVPIWSVITDLERNIAPLYRHAQPAPVVGSEPEAWLWSRGGDDERDVSLTPPDDDDDAADAIECGWTATPLYRHAQQPVVPEEITSASAPEVFEIAAEAERLGLRGTYASYAVGWNACRAAMLAAAPQSIGSDPATVPGKWIPVSERMPENDVSVLTFDGMYKRVHHAMYGHWQCWEPEKITHWMPLPAAPQEVKSES